MSTPDQSSADDVALDLLQDLVSETAGEEQGIRNPIPPLDLIVDLSWRSVGRNRDFRTLPRGATMTVIVQVPSEAWIDPVHAFVHENDAGVMIIDGKANKKSWGAQEALIVDALDRGKTVCGIASDPETQLPALLRAAADLVLTVPAPTPELMRKAIRRHTGRSAPALTALDIGGLDLMDLAAALRPQTTPKACVKRLRAAAATRSVGTSHDATPLLQDLSGYGEARDWCLATLADIAAVRAGTLSPGELESAIFYGPPGTGKTTLARSLAKTSRLPLIQTSVADWFQKNSGHLGDVLQCVNDVFARARSSAPCILFIDELDSLPNRATMDNRGRDWWQSVINSVLMNTAEIRESRKGIVLLAATNHLEHIDAALLRPGRIDRRFRIDPPDVAGLAGILRSHLGADCPAADLMTLARLMPGRTGADVTGFVREARRLARSAGRPLAEADLRAAIMPVDPRAPQELRHVAIHEAGHAVIAHRLGFRVEGVTIRAAGTAGGWTGIVLPSVSDRMRIEARVQLLLAGRAANEAFGASADTGASSDLAEATRLLAAARTSFGLAGQLVVRSQPDDALALVARDLTLAEAVNREMARLMIATRRMVGESRNDIQRVADALVDRGALDASELDGLLGKALGSGPAALGPLEVHPPPRASGKGRRRQPILRLVEYVDLGNPGLVGRKRRQTLFSGRPAQGLGPSRRPTRHRPGGHACVENPPGDAGTGARESPLDPDHKHPAGGPQAPLAHAGKQPPLSVEAFRSCDRPRPSLGQPRSDADRAVLRLRDRSRTGHAMSRPNEEDDGYLPDIPPTLVERAAELGLRETRAFIAGKRDRSPDAARKARSRRKQRENGFVEITLKIRDDPAVMALLRRLAGAPLGTGELYAVARMLEDDWDRDLVLRLASAQPDRHRLPVDAVIDLISGFLARGELATAMVELRRHPDIVSRLVALCRQRQERGRGSTPGVWLGRRIRSLLRIG